MRIGDWLSPEEIVRYTSRSNWRAAGVVLSNWLIVAAAFAIPAIWMNPLTLLAAVAVLAGRQMGLAVLMHEAGHGTLFKAQALNQWIGRWLCAYPVLGNMDAYAASHREHHKLAGTREDPDLPNYQAYPVSRASFRRKIVRDLSGRTGARLVVGLFGRRSGDIMMRSSDQYPSTLPQGLFVNAILFGVLAACGVPLLYLLWVVAYLTLYTAIARIRQVAEHANVANLYDRDPRLNTRTTLANPVERLFVAPNHVNYHAEHHFMASVPCYRLAALHKALIEKGYYEGYPDAVVNGYGNLLKRVVPELAAVHT
ncbi:MAG: fatty acid desaturase [Nevskiaceae bacterium]|nr:MAG: fatty acid desaturase [Nevskiaceae bacterium]TBR74784.1 MAG: fatty acid desaturase [Nevskiaceae bacterium]